MSTAMHADDRDLLARVYGAYGYALPGDDLARAGYAGEIAEHLPNWYMPGGRLYLPALRRFAAPDALSPFDAGGFCRYGYCAGDPVNRVDPSGAAWWDWLGMALGIVATVAATVATLGAAAPVSAMAMAGIVADVVSVTVELASLVALEAGDEGAAGILGWIAFGTGIASVGLSAGAALVNKSTARMARDRRRSLGIGYPVKINDKGVSEWSVSRPHAEIKEISGGGLKDADEYPELANRIIPRDGGLGIRPITMSFSNAQGGSIYTYRTKTWTEEIVRDARRLAGDHPDRIIDVFIGGHGSRFGPDWTKKGRFETLDERSYRDAKNDLRRVANVRVHYIDMKSEKFMEMLEEDDHLKLVGWCWSCTDEKVNIVRAKTEAGPFNYVIYTYERSL